MAFATLTSWGRQKLLKFQMDSIENVVSNFFGFTYYYMGSVVPVRVAADSFCDLVSVATFAVFVAAAEEKRRKPQNQYKLRFSNYWRRYAGRQRKTTKD